MWSHVRKWTLITAIVSATLVAYFCPVTGIIIIILFTACLSPSQCTNHCWHIIELILGKLKKFQPEYKDFRSWLWVRKFHLHYCDHSFWVKCGFFSSEELIIRWKTKPSRIAVYHQQLLHLRCKYTQMTFFWRETDTDKSCREITQRIFIFIWFGIKGKDGHVMIVFVFNHLGNENFRLIVFECLKGQLVSNRSIPSKNIVFDYLKQYNNYSMQTCVILFKNIFTNTKTSFLNTLLNVSVPVLSLCSLPDINTQRLTLELILLTRNILTNCDFMAWINNHIPLWVWGVITHPCPTTKAFVVKLWLNLQHERVIKSLS